MKKATVDLFTRIFAVLAPPPNMTISQWADKYRRLSSESSAEPGRWRTSKAPYQREIMDAVCDMRIQKVVIMSAAQIGKTDALILNPIGYYMHYDPSPIMVMQPTIQMAETFSKDRLSPMLRDTPVLRDRVNDKSRNSGNTILQKIFPGGHVTMVGANSPSSLASRPIRILLADEIDRYPATAGNEGDPLLLAGKRLATFWNKKEVCVSTPTNKETSRIAVEFEHSTQEEWNVPCPACGAYTPLLWANIIFDRDKLDEIGCACPACGVVSSETEWKEQFGKGKFVAAHPERKVRGFHLNALASLFVEWREIVEKFLTANEEKKKGNIELLKVWTNTEMGETWEEEGEQIETDDLFKRRERYNCEVPEEVLVLTAGVDVQDDRFEVEVVGWGVDKESWGIKYQAIYGDLKLKPVWDELDKFLSQTFTTADGRRLPRLQLYPSATQGSEKGWKLFAPAWIPADTSRHRFTDSAKSGRPGVCSQSREKAARKCRTSIGRQRRTISKPLFSLSELTRARPFYINDWRCRKRGRIIAIFRVKRTGGTRKSISAA